MELHIINIECYYEYKVQCHIDSVDESLYIFDDSLCNAPMTIISKCSIFYRGQGGKRNGKIISNCQVIFRCIALRSWSLHHGKEKDNLG